ncbi:MULTISPECIES: C40 family peptidase [unclassified Paenibacillus]|uniref:C40 family peptidase n=1 Tax=unclassified Paenibacillus TaxID=185978 RepID=UPI001AE86DDA|nr:MULTISPECIES: C40 family peptidase [unclassified Paenibacillus]MBP1155672.1 cell wall-associated NlpC family hydrolase [Paenibacillus sp. PvP091]MBP1168942.1 cell wall-associated NlpC family hydrolase [Paenibacillus sp. PvR098]MBP2439970.1 cell wall-associated NlpC family hydrolase [Paenibacillus sp. PvP052]
MNNLISKRWGRLMMSVSLSAALIMTGTLAGPATPVEAVSSSKASSIVSTSKKYMNTPYKFGAKMGQTRTFDCSSFVKTVYAKNGITVPRTSKAQSKAGKFVPKSQLKPGDLVFFYKPISHVGIYIGNGNIIHTYGKPGVTIDNINKGWWKKNYTTARRVS